MENTQIAQNEQTAQNEQKTFDELLKNPDYQREFDKKLESARTKWQTKWEEEANRKLEEAEKLAKMTQTEKHQHELDVANQEKTKAVNELNAYKLKDIASKIASEKGVDNSFLDLFDFSKETAETISTKIDVLKEKLDKSVEHKMNEKLNQTAPENHEAQEKTNDFSRASY